jgi:hypothetical protein
VSKKNSYGVRFLEEERHFFCSFIMKGRFHIIDSLAKKKGLFRVNITLFIC